MIIVKNRELLIPNEEYNIGTTYDNKTENRIFQLKRITSGGVDLANLTFSLDLEYANGAKDTCLLSKEVTADSVNLRWDIIKTMLQIAGTVLVSIRGLSADGVQKWGSFTGAFFVEDNVNTPQGYKGDLSLLEQIGAEFTDIKANEALRNKNEETRQINEAHRVAAEVKREQTEKEMILAKDNANAAVADINRRLQTGAFIGPQGPQGPQGTSGVAALTSGMYYLSLEPNGDLYVEFPDANKAPVFEYDSATGNLYYLINEDGTPMIVPGGTRQVELQNNGTDIQWKYNDENNTQWRNLASMNDLKGKDGQTPQMSIKEDGHLYATYQ